MTSARIFGLVLVAVGVWVCASPIWTGEWAIALLGFPLALAGLAKIVHTFRDGRGAREAWLDYAQGALLAVCGPLLFAAPSMTFARLKAAVILYLVAFAGLSLFDAWRRRSERQSLSSVVAAAAMLAIAVFIWSLGARRGMAAIGLAAGFAIIATGWRMILAPAPARATLAPERRNLHPDLSLGLPESERFAELNQHLREANTLRSGETLRWMGFFLVTFLAIHAVRMGATMSFEGLTPALVATLGDLMIAVVAFWLLILPARLLWRRMTRSIERRLWRERLERGEESDVLKAGAHRLVDLWLDGRHALAFNFQRARGSLVDALSMAVGNGLLIAALLVAINSIWGFSWYFNTENWASGVYQIVTGPRVDLWREAMAKAVLAGAGQDAQSAFGVTPPGLSAGQDFSFIVIGDPGEGDASQLSLKDRYLEVARREDVKFLVISSDVIYPAGEMKDYERNFYMPLKGVEKPIYAIPGNHDWFNALSGFAANLMRPDAALAAMKARVDADLGVSLMDERKRRALVEEAARLRSLYRVQTALQSAPYFDFQTEDFALIAIDTGVLRTIDPQQRAWLDGALDRAKGKFVMALVGHPRFAGGADTTAPDEELRELYDLLEARGVAVAMAGDTHDFEFYEQRGAPGPRGPLRHFVNGGGGAYLSVGTALDWPSEPATTTWAYYPSTKAVQDKLGAQTPGWKRPALWWIRWARGWPVSVETLSGLFDFNKAPFFQSFMEVQVRRSRNEVRYVLHGVDGPLRWRDLDRSFTPADAGPDDDAAFVFPLKP